MRHPRFFKQLYFIEFYSSTNKFIQRQKPIKGKHETDLNGHSYQEHRICKRKEANTLDRGSCEQ